MKKVIYDFGANNGDDVEYYLKKADLVVAVEADPTLCADMGKRFADEIASGRLVIENCVLAEEDPPATTVPFYLKNQEEETDHYYHAVNQFPRPADDQIHHFTEVQLPARSSVDIVRQYGEAYYIKVDIEHYDHRVLEALFRGGVKPPYISAETHIIDVFAQLVLNGYGSFKLIDGETVPVEYGDAAIETLNGPGSHSFKLHSAGPFGNDIKGPWWDKNNFIKVLNLGWKDIHASLVDPPNAGTYKAPPFDPGLKKLGTMMIDRLQAKAKETIAARK